MCPVHSKRTAKWLTDLREQFKGERPAEISGLATEVAARASQGKPWEDCPVGARGHSSTERYVHKTRAVARESGYRVEGDALKRAREMVRELERRGGGHDLEARFGDSLLHQLAWEAEYLWEKQCACERLVSFSDPTGTRVEAFTLEYDEPVREPKSSYDLDTRTIEALPKRIGELANLPALQDVHDGGQRALLYAVRGSFMHFVDTRSRQYVVRWTLPHHPLGDLGWHVDRALTKKFRERWGGLKPTAERAREVAAWLAEVAPDRRVAEPTVGC
jgi:hypothetical protein